jgi:diacylglycerol kinase (ATP)
VRVLVIANPIAGGGRACGKTEALRRALSARGHEVEVFLTARGGDAALRARRIDGHLDRIVVVGGDGTLNEVLNGLVDPGRVPIAQLPTGTANMLGHELGLPGDPREAAAMVEGGEVRRLDMGRMGERRFLMVASAGFDAMVTRHLGERRSGRLGYRGYAKPILRVLADYEPPSLTVNLDDGPDLACQALIASNLRNYGGLFRVSDDARPDSGLLHVCVIENASIRSLGAIALAGATRSFARSSRVDYRTAKNVRIEAATPCPVEVDGDHAGSAPIEVDLVPAAIPVVVPRG